MSWVCILVYAGMRMNSYTLIKVVLLCLTHVLESLEREYIIKKYPCLYGRPNKFYQRFWKDLSPPFRGMLGEIYTNDMASFAQKLEVMSLKHKNKSQFKNCRLISLTNIDYKISRSDYKILLIVT